MSGEDDSEDHGARTRPDPKEAKLAEALRANLRRRKAGAAKAKVGSPTKDDPKTS